MPNDVLAPLHSEFRLKMRELVRICLEDGVTILPYCGIRLCSEQAKLFRQSRALQAIEKRAPSLRDRDFGFLAQILLDVGPQPGALGRHVTNAGPGESWHQYAMAADCVPVRLGKAVWEGDDPAWKVYGSAAKHVGLTWAGEWVSFREMPHVQLYAASSPRKEWAVHADMIEQILKDVGALG